MEGRGGGEMDKGYKAGMGETTVGGLFEGIKMESA